MVCSECRELRDISDLTLPYVTRTCSNCKREIKLRDPGAHGLGFKVEKGDNFTIPAGFLNLAANPLKGNSRFTTRGLSWFAELVFGAQEIAQDENRGDFSSQITQMIERNEVLLRDLSYLKDLDIDDEKNSDEIYRRINENKKSPEWWTYISSVFYTSALVHIKSGDANKAAWSIACAERFRSLSIFKSYFEEPCYIGHSTKRLVEMISIWENNKKNSDEEFWQIKISENAYALSQIFSVPVTILQGKAYVGGSTIEGKDSRFLDFLISGGGGENAILIEIKTPTARLLGSRYRRNVYSSSAELSGAIIQANDYCHQLTRNVHLHEKNKVKFNTFNPRKIIIIGNYEFELNDERRKSSFELFRTSLTGIEIITFDEFFKKIEELAKLFHIVRRADV